MQRHSEGEKERGNRRKESGEGEKRIGESVEMELIELNRGVWSLN